MLPSLRGARQLWAWWRAIAGSVPSSVIVREHAGGEQAPALVRFGELELDGRWITAAGVEANFRWPDLGVSPAALMAARAGLGERLCGSDGHGLAYARVAEATAAGGLTGPGLAGGPEERPEARAGCLDDATIPVGGWRLLHVSLRDYFELGAAMGFPLRRLYETDSPAVLVALDRDLAADCHVEPEPALAAWTVAHAFPRWPLDRGRACAGPGHFRCALKVYRLTLRRDGAVEAQVVFVAAPRVERLVSVGGRAPLMGTIDLLERVVPSFGRGLRDRLESRMLALHVAVHDRAMGYLRAALAGEAEA